MKQTVKYLIFAVLILLIYCIESAFGEEMTVFDVSPEVLPYAVATIAVFCGETSGAWFGALAGFLVDMSSPMGMGIAMPVWFFAGAFGGKWTKQYLRRGFSGVFLFGLAASAVKCFGTALLSFGFGSEAPLSLLLLNALKIAAYSAVLSPVVYGAFRLTDRLLPAARRFENYPRFPVIRGFTAGRAPGGRL